MLIGCSWRVLSFRNDPKRSWLSEIRREETWSPGKTTMKMRVKARTEEDIKKKEVEKGRGKKKNPMGD